MRVLSIASPLPNRAVDNHSIFNAPAVFDYDAIVVDPARVQQSILEVVDASAAYHTHADVPVVNGESTPFGAGMAELLKRRRDEFARALERGAVVAVVTQPQAMLTGVSGFTGCDRYFFLPAPPGLAWDSTLLRGGEGTAAAVVDHAHPFSPVIDALRPDLRYRAYFDDRAPGFAGAARVFARSPGGAPVAVHFKVGGGHVVFLPARKSVGGSEGPLIAAAVVEAMGELLAVEDAERPPWLSGQPLPGLAEREDAVKTARQRLQDAEAALASSEAAASELAQVRHVLWRGTERGLLPAVTRCLVLLGFRDWPGERPVVRSPEGELHLEVAGSREAVDMAPHYRLRQRLDAVIERHERAPRGLVVVNGDRLTAPGSRGAQYKDSLRVAAEATGYALLTATELFAAARYALEGGEEPKLAEMRRRLHHTNGLVTLTDILAERAEQPEDAVEAGTVASEGGDG